MFVYTHFLNSIVQPAAMVFAAAIVATLLLFAAASASPLWLRTGSWTRRW